MPKPISFAPQARDEVNAAARRYGEERPELRVEFHAAIKEALDRMVRLSPHLGTPPLVPPGRGIKRVFVERFPFPGAADPIPRPGGRPRTPAAVLLA